MLTENAMEWIWHYVGTPLLTLAVVAVGGLLFKRSVNRSTLNKLNETNETLRKASDAYELAYKQRGEELQLLTERFGRLQARFDELERRYNEISGLNVGLQLEVKARDITIADLQAKVLILESEVKVLQGKLNSFI